MDLLKLLLERRGMTWSEYVSFSSSEKNDLLDIDKMADALDDVYNKGDKIVVLSDFDMDGIMSEVVLYAGLSELGFNVECFIPSSTKGYGFDTDDIDNLIQRHSGVTTIITSDVGISEFESVKYAQSKGLRVLVTDHHLPQSGYLSADVAVNPNRVDDSYANKSICGAYVAWQVLDYYVRHKRNDWFLTQQIEYLKVFAGIGTISDMMVLSGENRDLVNDSLTISKLLLGYDLETKTVDVSGKIVPQFFKSMSAKSENYKNAFYGLSRLYYNYARQDKPRLTTKKDLTATFYGFYVAPLFNSLKRLGGDMSHAHGVFFDKPSNQQRHIDVLFSSNELRKQLVDEYMSILVEEEENGLQPLAPYVYTSKAPGGILGLLATRLIKHSGLPTLVLNGDDMNGYHGSGRSPEWYAFNSNTQQYNLGILAKKYKMTVNEVERLLVDANLEEDDRLSDAENEDIRHRKSEAMSHKLIKYISSKRAEQYFVAGHEGAFGFGAKSFKHLVKFRDYLVTNVDDIWTKYVEEHGQPKSPEDFTISLLGDGDVGLNLSDVYDFMHDLEYIQPFGMGWPEPLIKFRFNKTDVDFTRVGPDQSHLKLVFHQYDGFTMMVWSLADLFESFDDDANVEVMGNLSWNYFNERWSVNFIGDSMKVVN